MQSLMVSGALAAAVFMASFGLAISNASAENAVVPSEASSVVTNETAVQEMALLSDGEFCMQFGIENQAPAQIAAAETPAVTEESSAVSEGPVFVAAIVVDVTQSATIAAPGQMVEDTPDITGTVSENVTGRTEGPSEPLEKSSELLE